jgi:hypothetical protein
MYVIPGASAGIAPVDAAGLMRFSSPHVKTFLVTAHHMHMYIRVLLEMRRLAAISLDIGHRSTDHQVLILHLCQIGKEPLMVICAMSFIDLKGDGVDRIQRVHTDAALEAGTSILSHSSLHLPLHDEFISALSNMQKAIRALSCDRRDHAGQLRLSKSQIVGFGHGIH